MSGAPVVQVRILADILASLTAIRDSSSGRNRIDIHRIQAARFSLHLDGRRRKNIQSLSAIGGGSMSSNRVMTALVVGLVLTVGVGTARAQGWGSAQQNMQFDQQFNAQLQAHQAQNQMAQTQLL